MIARPWEEGFFDGSESAGAARGAQDKVARIFGQQAKTDTEAGENEGELANLRKTGSDQRSILALLLEQLHDREGGH